MLLKGNQSLSRKLNGFNETKTYKLSAKMNWSLGVNRSIAWLPSNMNPISYLPSYNLLSGEEKLKFNQYYALGLCEKFVFLEECLITSITKLLQVESMNSQLRLQCEQFVEEEKDHCDLFINLCNVAEPKKYNGKPYYFLKQFKSHNFFADFIFKKPNLFLFWSWLAVYFEEKTIIVSHEYVNAKKSVDSLFCKAHFLHLQDELQHVQFDIDFINNFYKTKSNYKKKIAVKMLYNTVNKIIVPSKTLKIIFKSIINELKIKDTSVYDSLLKEIKFLMNNKLYMDVMFKKEKFKTFSNLVTLYPEMSPLNKFLC